LSALSTGKASGTLWRELTAATCHDVSLIPVDRIERAILIVRGRKVMLDSDLAALYGTTTKRLTEQMRRNRERFPEDFLFQLTRAEVVALNRSQFATGSQKRRDPRFRPFAFTEHGASIPGMRTSSRFLPPSANGWLRPSPGRSGPSDSSRPNRSSCVVT